MRLETLRQETAAQEDHAQGMLSDPLRGALREHALRQHTPARLPWLAGHSLRQAAAKLFQVRAFPGSRSLCHSSYCSCPATACAHAPALARWTFVEPGCRRPIQARVLASSSVACCCRLREATAVQPCQPAAALVCTCVSCSNFIDMHLQQGGQRLAAGYERAMTGVAQSLRRRSDRLAIV